MNTSPHEAGAARRCAGAALATLGLAAAVATTLTRSDAPPAPIAQRIDLNAADASLLTLLPNIGPARAAAIVADREAHGPFNRLEDLAQVRGLGARTIDDLAPYTVLASPSDSRRH